MAINNVVGDNIRKLRTKAGMTQEDLAFKSELSQGFINQLESGKRRFTQNSLEKIAPALGISVGELFKGIKSELPKPGAALMAKTRKKPFPKREFLSLLSSLPDHVVEHYLILLRLEKNIWEKQKR